MNREVWDDAMFLLDDELISEARGVFPRKRSRKAIYIFSVVVASSVVLGTALFFTQFNNENDYPGNNNSEIVAIDISKGSETKETSLADTEVQNDTSEFDISEVATKDSVSAADPSGEIYSQPETTDPVKEFTLPDHSNIDRETETKKNMESYAAGIMGEKDEAEHWFMYGGKMYKASKDTSLSWFSDRPDGFDVVLIGEIRIVKDIPKNDMEGMEFDEGDIAYYDAKADVVLIHRVWVTDYSWMLLETRGRT